MMHEERVSPDSRPVFSADAGTPPNFNMAGKNKTNPTLGGHKPQVLDATMLGRQSLHCTAHLSLVGAFLTLYCNAIGGSTRQMLTLTPSFPPIS